MVGLDIGDAGRAKTQVLIQELLVVGRKVAGHVIDEQGGQLAASHHAPTSSK
jgi:hypothetical protein